MNLSGCQGRAYAASATRPATSTTGRRPSGQGARKPSHTSRTVRREQPSARNLRQAATGAQSPLDLRVPIHREPPPCHTPIPFVVVHDGTGPSRLLGRLRRWSQYAKSRGAYPGKSGGHNPGNRLVSIRKSCTRFRIVLMCILLSLF